MWHDTCIPIIMYIVHTHDTHKQLDTHTCTEHPKFYIPLSIIQYNYSVSSC